MAILFAVRWRSTIKKSTKIQGDNDDINVGLEEARLFEKNITKQEQECKLV